MQRRRRFWHSEEFDHAKEVKRKIIPQESGLNCNFGEIVNRQFGKDNWVRQNQAAASIRA